MSSASMSGSHGKSHESAADATVTRVRQAADEAIDSTARYAKGKTEAAEGVAKEAIDRTARASTGAAEAVRSFGSETIELTRRTVEQHPLASLGVAAAIGFLIGSILRR